MKKKAVKITLSALLMAAVAAYLAVALGHAQQLLSNVVCSKLEVVIQDSALNQFVRKSDIPAIFRASKKTYFGKRLSEISTHELEQALHERSLIKRAEVHTTADGTLHVSIQQRCPIVRVYAGEQNFYIDVDGYIVQPYSGYTSHVPIVSGHLASPFPHGYKGSMMDFFTEKKVSDPLYMQIYSFAKYLNQQPFWKAQVEQIYLTKSGKVELIPRVGAQIISLGSFENFEYKLHKLLTLYEKGIAIKGWNAYDAIDLSYSNQVVCKLR
jgi:cell division protein FtsQ